MFETTRLLTRPDTPDGHASNSSYSSLCVCVAPIGAHPINQDALNHGIYDRRSPIALPPGVRSIVSCMETHLADFVRLTDTRHQSLWFLRPCYRTGKDVCRPIIIRNISRNRKSCTGVSAPTANQQATVVDSQRQQRVSCPEQVGNSRRATAVVSLCLPSQNASGKPRRNVDRQGWLMMARVLPRTSRNASSILPGQG